MCVKQYAKLDLGGVSSEGKDQKLKEENKESPKPPIQPEEPPPGPPTAAFTKTQTQN